MERRKIAMGVDEFRAEKNRIETMVEKYEQMTDQARIQFHNLLVQQLKDLDAELVRSNNRATGLEAENAALRRDLKATQENEHRWVDEEVEVKDAHQVVHVVVPERTTTYENNTTYIIHGTTDQAEDPSTCGKCMDRGWVQRNGDDCSTETWCTCAFGRRKKELDT